MLGMSSQKFCALARLLLSGSLLVETALSNPLGYSYWKRAGDCVNCLNLDSYEVAALIPWSGDTMFNEIPNVRVVTSNGFSAAVSVDASFTGLALPGAWFEVSEDNPPEGGHADFFYSDNGMIVRGYWISDDTANITFPDASMGNAEAGTTPVVANFNVFAVTSLTSCAHYNVTSGNGTCLTPANELDAGSAAYLGIGVGTRPTTVSTDIVPMTKRNVLLNIKQLTNTGPVYYTPEEKTEGAVMMRRGFKIMPGGLIVGLTKQNSQDAYLQKLEPASSDHFDWLPPLGCLTVDDSECTKSYVMPDFQFEQAIIYTDHAFSGATPTAWPYTVTGGALEIQESANQTVEVTLDDYAGSFSYRVGDGDSSTPDNFIVIPQDYGRYYANIPSESTISVYTLGRKFWRNWGSIYDAEGGYYGLQGI